MQQGIIGDPVSVQLFRVMVHPGDQRFMKGFEWMLQWALSKSPLRRMEQLFIYFYTSLVAGMVHHRFAGAGVFQLLNSGKDLVTSLRGTIVQNGQLVGVRDADGSPSSRLALWIGFLNQVQNV